MPPDTTCRRNQQPLAACLLDRRNISPGVIGILHIDATVEFHDIRLHRKLLDDGDRVFDIEHIHHRVDAGLPGFGDSLLDGGGGCKTGDHNSVGAGVSGHPGLKVPGVERL